MIELNEAFGVIHKAMQGFASENEYTFVFDKETMESRALPIAKEENTVTLTMEGASGTAIVQYNGDSNKIRLLGSADQGATAEDSKELSVWLLDPKTSDESDVKSISNDFMETIRDNFGKKQDKDLDNVKLPHSVSKSKAKSGVLSYDPQTLANRFVQIFPEYKNDLKANIAKYDELLPIEFCTDYIVPKTLEVLRGHDKALQKKLINLFNDIYEDGSNEVQDLVAVVILGALDNDPKLLSIADEYMSEYMGPTVHHINKMLAGPIGAKFKKEMKDPPPYKPKKKKQGLMQKLMGGGGSQLG